MAPTIYVPTPSTNKQLTGCLDSKVTTEIRIKNRGK